MLKIDSLLNKPLVGGFFISAVETTSENLEDALGRDAVAQTRIVGKEFRIAIRAGLSDEEVSITLYHEVLEAATVACVHCPESVMEFNEAAFEASAHLAHATWGEATFENINRMLQFYGFGRE